MKFIVETLGCKVNSYESDALSVALLNSGFSLAKIDEDVDVAIINTCSVTSTSDKKSRQQIRKLIRSYPNAIVVAMGCYVQIAHNELKTIPGLDILVGTSLRSSIPTLIEQFKKDGKQIDAVEEEPRLFTYEEIGATSYTSHTRAYLKIQDGCDNFCSYCIIPYSRGKNRSRLESEVIAEAVALVEKGYPEIVLTGIHTGGYGFDLEATNLTILCKKILAAAPGLVRLRISSLEETEITPELIHLIKSEPRMAKHLHIPLQSGSSKVLRRMNRRYDTDAFLAKLDEIRREIPLLAITTDVIVGFPGEEEEEFKETVAFIKKANFSELHVFPFSSRSGTPASKMRGQVDPQVKKDRVQVLLAVSEELNKKYKQQFVGQSLTVIFENFDENKKVYRGHTSNYLLVEQASNENLSGKIKSVIYQMQ